MISEEFVLWVMGDAHVGTDLKSGAKALRRRWPKVRGVPRDIPNSGGM